MTIEGVDRSACGGTHVARTGENGAILLRGAEKTKGATRITFLCGARAVRQARHDATLLEQASRTLSASPDDLPELVARHVVRLTASERDRKRLAQALATYMARERYDATPPGTDGIRRVLGTGGGDVQESEPLAQRLIALGGCAVLVLDVLSDQTGGILFATSEDTNFDAGQLLRAALQLCDGRGGGSPRFARGAVPDATHLPAFRTTLGF